jgi:hypothetical protein
VPLAEDKTVEPVQILTFLGIEFDTLKMELRLPSEFFFEIKITLELFMHLIKNHLNSGGYFGYDIAVP